MPTAVANGVASSPRSAASGPQPTESHAMHTETPHSVQYKKRNPSRDGLGNRLNFFFLTRFKWLWTIVQSIAPLKRRVNGRLVNSNLKKGETRPSPFSTHCDFTSWPSLTDRTYYSRHLPPAKKSMHPDLDRVVQLFDRSSGGGMRYSNKSTVLFSHFAQWFTDGLLRTDRTAIGSQPPLLKNTSNHEIDLCNLYGLTKGHTDILRSKEGGRMKCQTGPDGNEWPMFHTDERGVPFREFEHLPLLVPTARPLDPDQNRTLFAMGTERGNVTPGYAMMNILFLREHNRVAGVLQKAYPCWDDDRLFETTRNVLIHLLLKVVIHDYINHIAPYHFKFEVYGGQKVRETWYRTNWVAIEFNLLYRWHSLVPDRVYFGDHAEPSERAFYRNRLLLDGGLRAAYEGASAHRAGMVGLLNTPRHLWHTEKASLNMARNACLAPYNDYREAFKFPRVTDVSQISSDPLIQKGLMDVYGDVNNIELYVGLFAEDTRPNSVLAQLIGRMVGIDAFSQALTNPLLAERVYSEKTFSEAGMDIIKNTSTLNDIAQRNIPGISEVSFTHRDYVRT